MCGCLARVCQLLKCLCTPRVERKNLHVPGQSRTLQSPDSAAVFCSSWHRSSEEVLVSALCVRVWPWETILNSPHHHPLCEFMEHPHIWFPDIPGEGEKQIGLVFSNSNFPFFFLIFYYKDVSDDLTVRVCNC